MPRCAPRSCAPPPATCPSFEPRIVEPAFAGVRAQALARDGRLVDDFVFSSPSGRCTCATRPRRPPPPRWRSPATWPTRPSAGVRAGGLTASTPRLGRCRAKRRRSAQRRERESAVAHGQARATGVGRLRGARAAGARGVPVSVVQRRRLLPERAGFVAIVFAQALVLRTTLAERPFEGFSRTLAIPLIALMLYAAFQLASALWSHATANTLDRFVPHAAVRAGAHAVRLGSLHARAASTGWCAH